jgi:hypothetical protein
MSAFDLSKFSKSAQAAIARLRGERTAVLVVFSHGCIISDFVPMGAEAGLGPEPEMAMAMASAPELPSHIKVTMQSLEEFDALRSTGTLGGDTPHRIAPRSIASTPGLAYAGSQCIAVPAGIRNFAKLNWGVLGTTTGVDYRSSHAVQVVEGADGSQPNNFLYVLRECVQEPLKANPFGSIDDVCKEMQTKMRGELLAELKGNITTEIGFRIDELKAARLKWSAVNAKTTKPAMGKIIKQLHDATKGMQASEDLGENLDRLFNYALHAPPSSVPCMLNKKFKRSDDEDEKFPGPDWNILAVARDGRFLVANIIQRAKRGKVYKTNISKQWPLEWMAKGPDWFPEINEDTVNDWDMDMISLVEEWKKLKQGGLKKPRDLTPHLYDEMSISTQDILTFLEELGIVDVIVVDCSCNILSSQTEYMVCAPDDVRCEMCKSCGRSMADHAHGGGGYKIKGERRYTKRVKYAKHTKHTKRMRTKPKQN